MSKVSIIVPIYNIQDYLSWAVESLIRQTERDIEIILVDDGSKDNSGILCDQYSNKDSRIKTIHKKNGGLSSARNTGVKEATSEYVIFLDGDDYLCDDAIETLVMTANNYQPDIVQFLYREVNESGCQQFHDLEKWEPFVASKPCDLFKNLYNWGGVAASGCTKLIKRELLLEYPFENIRHEDEMWCTRVFPKGVTIVYIPDILYNYVMREGSIIHSNFSINKMDIFIIHEKRIETLKQLNLYNLANLIVPALK